MPFPIALLALALQQPAADRLDQPVRPYWQQQVAYDIRARLDEPTGVLSGTQRMAYVNRSPDTLTTIAFHLHLNAFRPGSRWSDADSVEGRRRFNDLADPDYAFNHVRNVRVMGQTAEPIWPVAPDSTVVRFALPKPLAPGDSMTVEMEWDARPSTVPRRQGRRGRRFDFAQWYPKVVVYDKYGWQEHPLYPAGEFYGEFATYRVDLDVPADQVVGATGVPVCGDPGWQRANQTPSRAIEYRRDFYAAYSSPPDCGSYAERDGRKRIFWYAEDVHHFALSLNPDYRYEGGRWGDVAVHVLYLPADRESWGNGIAVKRTEAALAWLDKTFGTFAWPQITNVHRIEGGGTEFPMMIHDGSASQGLIVHELGHNYTMGILANNEWREGWLDEGFTSFQTTLFFESAGPTGAIEENEAQILQLDLDGSSEPVSLVSEDYRDFATYGAMNYGKGELFFHLLRDMVGADTMQQILRTFYDRWKLRHVDEQAFREVAEEVSGRDLRTFFGQFLHATAFYDYGVGRVKRARLANGRWRTRVEVVRKEEGRYPVLVGVLAAGQADTPEMSFVSTDGLAEREWVEVETVTKPRRVMLHLKKRTHDWNALNDERGFGPLGSLFQKRSLYADTYFSTPVRRDRKMLGVAPVAWYNDAGGITIGLRARENYFGRFEQNVLLVAQSTEWGLDGEGVTDTDFFLRYKNPVWFRIPNLSQTVETYHVEGRFGTRLAIERTRREHLTFGPERKSTFAIQWMHVDDARYLDRGYYDSVGTVELQWITDWRTRSGAWQLGYRLDRTTGIAYARDGLPDGLEDLYGRFSVEGTAKRQLGRFGVAARLFAGVTAGKDEPVKQRQTYLAGADPYEQFGNPFLRSRGALLVGNDFNYHTPGGAGLRGYDARLSTVGAVALNLELDRAFHSRPRGSLFNRVALAAFTDLGHAIDDGKTDRGRPRLKFLGDAGVGLRADHRIGGRRFTTRFDFPLWVSRPEVAQDTEPGTDELGFRWTVSFEPAF